MKLLISGSREITDYNILRRAIFEWAKSIHGDNIPLPLNSWIDEIISGGANGIDSLAERFAKEQNIDLVVFYANWSKGPSAGPKRNSKMGDYLSWYNEFTGDPVHILTIPKSLNSGTANMIGVGTRLKIPIFVHKECLNESTNT